LTECAPGAINLIDALLENPAIPMAAKARLRNIRGTVVAMQERSPKDHGFDFVAHLERQKRFSAHTFGPGTRARGIVDHIRKELLEVEADPGDLCEWVDVAILALDGAWRSGATPQEIAAAIVTKQTKNESRVWPHWSTMPADKAIEHDRSGEKPRSTPTARGIDPVDPWRGLYAPELMPKLDGVNDWIAAHPDLPQWPDDEERGIDNLIKAQGFAYAVVGDEYPDEDEAVELDPCAWLANWKPEPPAGEHWRLVMVQDTEDGPAAVFVRPLALIDAAPVAAAPVLDPGLYSWLQERGIVPDSHDGQIDMTEVVEALNEHERQLIASTPAAPGNDLGQFRKALHVYRHRMSHVCNVDGVKEADRLLALIDANPKGGSTDAKDAARYRWLKAERIQLWRDTLTGAPVSCSFDFDEPGHDVDAAIDAAMQATSAEVGA